MPIVKRRLDICGRERFWEYVVESMGRQYRVAARQLGQAEPTFHCSCGATTESDGSDESFLAELFAPPCIHIAEAQRDLNLARQAAAQMIV